MSSANYVNNSNRRHNTNTTNSTTGSDTTESTDLAHQPLSQEIINDVFAQLDPQDVEQFYHGFQRWTLQQQILQVKQQIAAIQQEIDENTERMQSVQPSPIALASLAQLQASGVNDVDLLDRMLERGEVWLDYTMQLLERCESLDLIHGDYTQWCEHALEGAYDWIASMSETSPASESPAPPTPPASSTRITRPLNQATEELLLQKLMSDEDETPTPPAPTKRITRPLDQIAKELSQQELPSYEVAAPSTPTTRITRPLDQIAEELPLQEMPEDDDETVELQAIPQLPIPEPTSISDSAADAALPEAPLSEELAPATETSLSEEPSSLIEATLSEDLAQATEIILSEELAPAAASSPIEDQIIPQDTSAIDTTPALADLLSSDNALSIETIPTPDHASILADQPITADASIHDESAPADLEELPLTDLTDTNLHEETQETLVEAGEPVATITTDQPSSTPTAPDETPIATGDEAPIETISTELPQNEGSTAQVSLPDEEEPAEESSPKQAEIAAPSISESPNNEDTITSSISESPNNEDTATPSVSASPNDAPELHASAEYSNEISLPQNIIAIASPLNNSVPSGEAALETAEVSTDPHLAITRPVLASLVVTKKEEEDHALPPPTEETPTYSYQPVLTWQTAADEQEQQSQPESVRQKRGFLWFLRRLLPWLRH
ncbi:MAG TPA: hypothetical protein VFB12_22165 [Ktedonobacteraceae bacterium]|nr:hypothetical protein [Ktedonobacteraceae bacterium]